MRVLRPLGIILAKGYLPFRIGREVGFEISTFDCSGSGKCNFVVGEFHPRLHSSYTTRRNVTSRSSKHDRQLLTIPDNFIPSMVLPSDVLPELWNPSGGKLAARRGFKLLVQPIGRHLVLPD